MAEKGDLGSLVYTGLYWVILVYTGLYWEGLGGDKTGKNGHKMAKKGHKMAKKGLKIVEKRGLGLLGYTGLYWDILGYTGLYWFILGYTGRDWEGKNGKKWGENGEKRP